MSEAERLAQMLEEESQDNPDDYRWEAAAELRRLSAELAECKAAYKSQFKELHALKASLGEPVAWRVRRHDSPKYWVIFMHKPIDALQDPDREVRELYDIKKDKP